MAADNGGESMEEVTDSEEERWQENERVKKCMLFSQDDHELTHKMLHNLDKSSK